MRKTLAICTFCTLIALTGGITACTTHSYYPFLYRAPLAQGNVINPADFAELKPGMNKAEVVNIVGDPILQTPFSDNVWHYVYTLREKGKITKSQAYTLYFNGDTLTQVSPS